MVNTVLIRVPAGWKKLIQKEAEQRKETVTGLHRRIMGEMMPQLQDFFRGMDEEFGKNK